MDSRLVFPFFNRDSSPLEIFNRAVGVKTKAKRATTISDIKDGIESTKKSDGEKFHQSLDS